MKYPQLVSARAVNAISDWLVSRLEKLGVDAPLVYSRLLLSLLHTPLQVNALDLAETLHIKGCIGRKGRRLTPSDAETLKRFAAVESLMEAAASDQQKTEVEDLVDELCEKLREIEKQNNLESEVNIIKASSDIEKPNNSSRSGSPAEDPTKRYYRAFPPLSAELGDTKIFTIQMPLSWPCGTTSKSNINTNVSNTAGVKKKTKRRRSQGLVKGKQSFVKKSMNNNNNDNESSSLWDTNFEGSWEMGHDLIREFIIKQNKRNRSISESDATKFIELNKMKTNNNFRFGEGIIRNINNNDGSNLIRNMVQATYAKEHYIDYDSLENDENSELFSPVSTNETCSFLFGSSTIRDEGYATPDTLTSFCEFGDIASNEPRRLYEREVSNESIDAVHNAATEYDNLALFEAKFNSSVEALWDDKEDNIEIENNNNQNELNIFWSNYYKHQYKPSDKFNENPILQQSSDALEQFRSNIAVDLLSGLLESPRQTNIKTDTMNSKKHEFIQAGTNLQNSIWSDNPNINLGENEDENSGLYSRELWESCETNNKKEKDSTYQVTAGYSIDHFVNFSKWSDSGSYEAPFVPQTAQTKLASVDYGSSIGVKSLSIKKNSDICYKQEMNLMQNFISKSNSLENRSKIESSSKITLVNHSETSGFTEVSPSSGSIGYIYDKYERLYRNDININKKRLTQNLQNATNNQEDENLLISERTHFRPIKQTYVDGYTFDIPSNIEEIKYERSESGSMYLDLDKYAIYNVLNTAYDEEDTNNFVLKFCVKQIEKYCQTDEDNDLLIDFDDYKDITTYRSDDPDIEMECEVDNWSMTKLKTKCINNNNHIHTLWGHCNSCNNTIKSFPANLLMKDELSADGDEIMSDLKYMQNLFIGTDWDEDDEHINVIEQDDENIIMEANEVVINKNEQDEIYCNVNKLISDLLKPETAKSLAQVLGCHQGQTILQEIALKEQKPQNPDDARRNLYHFTNIDKINNLKEAANINNNNNIKNYNNNYLTEDDVFGMWSKNDNAWDNCCNLKIKNDFELLFETDKSHIDIIALWNSVEPITNKNDGDSHLIPICLNLLKDDVLANNMQQQQRECFVNHTTNKIEINKLARFDRKRRHSASQNLNEDCNSDRFGKCAIGGTKDKYDLTTVITCKYWTKDSLYEGNLEMNPSTILKHVTMVSRPLTR